MRIRRKAIIKKIIEEEAEKRGFTLEFERRHSTFWPLVFIKRIGTGQFIEIREDLEEPGKISLMWLYKQSYDLYYHDEESFEEAIKEFQAKLEEDGYAILDEKMKQPRLFKADYDAVYLHWEELAEHFRQKKTLKEDNITFLQAIDVVEQELISLTGSKWDDAKSDFYEVTAFYAQMLLRIPDTFIYQYEGTVFYVKRTKGKSNMVAVMPELFTAYIKGGIKERLTRCFTDLLMVSELEKNGFENPYKC